MFKRKLRRKAKSKNFDLKTINKRTPFWKVAIIISPALIVLIAFTIIPFIIAIIQSFTVLDRYDGSIFTLGWANFERLFAHDIFQRAVSNTLLYAIISIPIIIVLSAVISSALANVIRKRLRGFWQTVFFLPYVTSAVAIAVTFAYLFDADTGLLNKLLGFRVPWLVDAEGSSALWAMLIYGVWRGLAFNILIFTTAMLGVNKDLYKSASINGAGPLKQFFRITLPSIRKTTNFLITIGLIAAIKVFPLALFGNRVSDGLNYNGATLLLYIFDAIQNGRTDLAGAASIVLLVVSITFTVVIRSTISISVRQLEKWGEKRVFNKIKDKTILR